MGQIKKELVAASSVPLVLAVLARGESYGYAIIRDVEQRSGGQLQWTEGMLYPVLHRLEKQGLIKSAWKVPEKGRKRKYYTVTAKGKKKLSNERSQWQMVNQTLQSVWECMTCKI